MAEGPYRSLVEAYVVGALEGQERSGFETYLAPGCATCQAQVVAREALAEVMARELPACAPDPSLRQQILDLAEAPALPLDIESYDWHEAVPGVKVHVVKEDLERGMRACVLRRE